MFSAYGARQIVKFSKSRGNERLFAAAITAQNPERVPTAINATAVWNRTIEAQQHGTAPGRTARTFAHGYNRGVGSDAGRPVRPHVDRSCEPAPAHTGSSSPTPRGRSA